MNVLINSGRISPFFNTRNKLLKDILRNSSSVTLSGYESDFKDELNKLGVSYEKTKVNRSGISPIRDLILIFSYYRIIKRKKIDVVHSYTIKPNIYGSIGARLAGIREIYPTINGLGFLYTGNSRKAKFLRLFSDTLYKIAFSCSKKVFFQNRDDANEMVRRGTIRKDKCVIIAGSGIDLQRFSYIQHPQDVSFIMATRLLKTKGVFYYLEAAKIVKRKYPNTEIKLIGPLDPNPDGIAEEELRRYVNKKIINYLGVTNQIHEVLGGSSVFVLPSYYREGVPHSILEAMATGRAVITTDAPGCRETVLDGINGFLVPIMDSKLLAEKMMWMIDNPYAIKKMGEESLKYARDKFDVRFVNDTILETMGIKR